MRLPFYVCLSVLTLGFGCKNGNGEDAGVDAEIVFDAGMDAGPVDSGPVDAGLPAPLVMEAMETATAANDLEAVRDSIPIDMRTSGAWADLDLAVFGLDLIIGETGLQGIQTLALEPPTTRAFVDLRQVRVVDDMLADAQMELGLTSQIGMAIGNVRAAIAAFRAELARLYEQRREIGLAGTEVWADDTPWMQQIVSTGGHGSLAFVAEPPPATTLDGGPTGTSVTINWSCSSTTALPSLRVIDEMTGMPLTTSADRGYVVTPSVTIMVPAGVESILSVELRTPPSYVTSTAYDTCSVMVTNPRHARARAIVPPDLTMLYRACLDSFHVARVAWGTTGDTTQPLVYERQLMRLAEHMAAISSPEPDGVPIEDLERLLYEDYYIDQMTIRLLSRTPPTGLEGIHAALTDIHTEAEAVVDSVRLLMP